MRTHWVSGRLAVALAALHSAVLGAGMAMGQGTIGKNFTGSQRFIDSGFIPPDTDGAVGAAHFVELINGRYSVYLKSSGVKVQTSTLDQFFNSAFAAGGGGFVQVYSFDPRVLYDAYSQRWFACAADNPGLPNSFLVAVSNTSDPTQGWKGFKIDSDTGNTVWADFPQIGLNKDVVCISANMYPISGGSVTTTMLVLPKADLLLPAPSVVNAKLFQNVPATGAGYSVQPAHSMDDTPLPLPVLSDYNTPAGNLKRSSVVGTVAIPSYPTAGGFIAVAPRPNPPLADQPAIGNPQKPPLDTGTTKFSGTVVQQNNELWAVQSVGGGAGAQVRWFRINASTNAVIQTGFIADAVNDYFYPSIAVNDLGTAVIGFTASGPALPASTYCVVGKLGGGAVTFGAPMLLKQGVEDYVALDQLGRNRWGDYSSTTVDPVDQTRFWTIQEFCPANDVWALQITEILTGCYPDCTGEGLLTIADFGCFQTKFVAGDPYADCNGVGGLTIADFGCFQTAFVGGCP